MSFILIAVVVVGVVLVLIRLDRLSRQLSNLYILQAWKRLPHTEDLDVPHSYAIGVPDRTEWLKFWERLNTIRFLSEGVSPEDASHATSKLWLQHARWIAQFAPERVENGCRGKKDGELCESCARSLGEVQALWARLMEKERAGERLKNEEYVIGAQECPKSGLV